MFYVYAIYNQERKRIYIGQTDNLVRRLKLHNNKTFSKSYTASFTGKWVVIYKEEHLSRGEAIKREKQLKSYRGRQFLKQYIPR